MDWDARYGDPEREPPADPLPFVVACLDRIPSIGDALDVATGAGRHAVLLARRGWRVVAVDRSATGLALAGARAAAAGVAIETRQVDLTTWRPPAASVDLVVATLFLERSLLPALAAALRPGGHLVHETFATDHLSIPGARPRRPEFLLEPGELARTLPDLEVVVDEIAADPDRVTNRFFARRP